MKNYEQERRIQLEKLTSGMRTQNHAPFRRSDTNFQVDILETPKTPIQETENISFDDWLEEPRVSKKLVELLSNTFLLTVKQAGYTDFKNLKLPMIFAQEGKFILLPRTMATTNLESATQTLADRLNINVTQFTDFLSKQGIFLVLFDPQNPNLFDTNFS